MHVPIVSVRDVVLYRYEKEYLKKREEGENREVQYYAAAG